MNKETLFKYLKRNHYFLDDSDAKTATRLLLRKCKTVDSLPGLYEIEREVASDAIVSLLEMSDPYELVKDEYEDKMVYEHQYAGFYLDFISAIHIPKDFIKEYREIQIDSLV